MIRQVSKEAWVLLAIIVGDTVYTIWVVDILGIAVEANPIFILFDRNLMLMLSVKILWALPVIAFLEACRLYPEKLHRVFSKSVIPGMANKTALSPTQYMRICIVLYSGIFIVWHIAQLIWPHNHWLRKFVVIKSAWAHPTGCTGLKDSHPFFPPLRTPRSVKLITIQTPRPSLPPQNTNPFKWTHRVLEQQFPPKGLLGISISILHPPFDSRVFRGLSSFILDL